MSAPDLDRTVSHARKMEPASQRRATIFRRALFASTTLSIAYLTLMPNRGGARFRLVPLPLYRWFAAPEHDWLMNVIAFGFFALVVFRQGKNFAHRIVRLAALLALVCAIEIAQKWIPGRVSSLDDVCYGWSGIFAAWLLCAVVEQRA